MDYQLIAGQLFNAASVASILFLVAVGLSLSFGIMGVINMAHGEILMLGGYMAYLTFHAVGGVPGVLLALAAAFCAAALLGLLLELSLIRRLAARPLDTLLATWGLGLILQQAARSLFGPIGVEVVASGWLGGTLDLTGRLLAGVSLAHVRLFILALAALVLGGIGVFLAWTPTGLLVRAVNQDRETAQTLGVDARRIDRLVFALGTGVAGLGGAAVALIAPVTPTVGQSYIVYAFMVVILGGLGSLLGTTVAALLVGLFSAGAQIFTSVSTADVLLLVFVIGFIQFRPRGIVWRRSRALED
ncbi:MAG: urea ABC transporter permease subunit UrtB [Deltaproteobacteria bacterium]|nr:urea ABC transporter permease subunit UrtB [Deltaproteobacteria bacterium]